MARSLRRGLRVRPSPRRDDRGRGEGEWLCHLEKPDAVAASHAVIAAAAALVAAAFTRCAWPLIPPAGSPSNIAEIGRPTLADDSLVQVLAADLADREQPSVPITGMADTLDRLALQILPQPL